jgi:putative flippase GtrA
MSLAAQFFRFLGVGGLCTAIHYAIMAALVALGWMAPVAASTLGFSISAVLNYRLNHQFTFQSGRTHAAALPRFIIVALTGLLINGALVAFAVSALQLHYVLAQLIATAGTVVWNFAVARTWAFAHGKQAPVNREDPCS